MTKEVRSAKSEIVDETRGSSFFRFLQVREKLEDEV